MTLESMRVHDAGKGISVFQCHVNQALFAKGYIDGGCGSLAVNGLLWIEHDVREGIVLHDLVGQIPM